jgi:hypothetical protein
VTAITTGRMQWCSFARRQCHGKARHESHRA